MAEIVTDDQGRVYERCRACSGTGRVEHFCTWPSQNLETVKLFWEHRGSFSYESLGIYRCRACSRYLMIRRQYDAGSGSDDIVLRVGESKRGYSFSQADLDEALREREGRDDV